METNQKIPAKDTRFKTSDVASTKGMSFKDFNLSQELQLVTKSFHGLSSNLEYL